MRVGILPAVGNGLVHMANQGQLPRLLANLEAYEGRCTYFSYQERQGEAKLWKSSLGRLAAPQRAPQSPMRYALTLPLRYWWTYGGLDVVRATSLLGAIPAMVGQLVHGVPYVVTYGADYLKIAEIHGRSAAHLRKWRILERMALATAGAVIVQNRELADTLRARQPNAKIRHLPNWVDTTLFRPRSKHDAPYRRVLYVGRLVEEKNLVNLAMGCRAAGFQLVCYGDGPLADTLQALGVNCPGPIGWQEIPFIYRNYAIFAMVSHTEGHCKALAEAMAAGMPCLVSTEVREGINPGINCLQVEGTPDEIQRGLTHLAENGVYAASLGTRARITAEQLWSKQRVLAQERALLAEVAG